MRILSFSKSQVSKIFLICCFAIIFPSLSFASVQIESIRVGVDKEKTRFVLDLSQKLTSYKAISTTDGTEIKFQLPDISGTLPTLHKPEGRILAFDWKSLEPKGVTLVLQVKPNTKVQKIFTLPPSGKYVHPRLVIDLAGSAPLKSQETKVEATKPPIKPKQLSKKKEDSYLSKIEPKEKPITAISTLGPLLHEKKRIVILDPGHGGRDSGSAGKTGVLEKHITLAFAREIKNHLELSGRYLVYLTRDADVSVPLRRRVAFARAKKANVFVSIHADANIDHKISGLSIYTLSKEASDEEAERLAEKENKADIIFGIDLSTKSDEVSNILIDLAQRETMNNSVHFARLFLKEVKEQIKLCKNTQRSADFAVLTSPDIPSMLLELGYLSNAADEKRLQQPSFRAIVASQLLTALDKYFFERHERKI